MVFQRIQECAIFSAQFVRLDKSNNHLVTSIVYDLRSTPVTAAIPLLGTEYEFHQELIQSIKRSLPQGLLHESITYGIIVMRYKIQFSTTYVWQTAAEIKHEDELVLSSCHPRWYKAIPVMTFTCCSRSTRETGLWTDYALRS